MICHLFFSLFPYILFVFLFFFFFFFSFTFFFEELLNEFDSGHPFTEHTHRWIWRGGTFFFVHFSLADICPAISVWFWWNTCLNTRWKNRKSIRDNTYPPAVEITRGNAFEWGDDKWPGKKGEIQIARLLKTIWKIKVNRSSQTRADKRRRRRPTPTVNQTQFFFCYVLFSSLQYFVFVLFPGCANVFE